MPRDPYETFRATAMALENEGVDVDRITDAMLCTGLNAANRLAGPEHVISFLLRMVEVFQAKAEGRMRPPTQTQ